ncbi:LOW QUALITY PROTEIN: hypothetical protein TorRG33x02_307340, partial [Trema orientale]
SLGFTSIPSKLKRNSILIEKFSSIENL